MAKLIIYEETENETVFETFELSDTSILIGSDAHNHLILDTPDIDLSHASLELRDGHWILQDLGGVGGTLVNGKVISGPFNLYDGDMIELNHIKLKFQDPERGVTKEFPRSPPPRQQNDVHMRGRIWFAAMGGATIAVIVIILLMLFGAYYLGIINLVDLLPPWLAGG